MITPSFTIQQDCHTVTVDIHAPYSDICNAEIDFVDRDFYFSSFPYFLHLHLTGDVKTDREAVTEYNYDSSTFIIKIPKLKPGQYFPPMSMSKEILKSHESAESKPIQMLEIDQDNCIQTEQTLVNGEVKDEKDERVCDYGYGFGWLKHGVLSKFGDELRELFDFCEVDKMPIDDRLARVQQEDERNFDSEYYLADLFDEPDELKEIKKIPFDIDLFKLNDGDHLLLKSLRVSKLSQFSSKVQQQISYSLVDVFFAYLFDWRITNGEHNALTNTMINKLAPSLSCMVQYKTAKQALCAAIRRCLCYSLYRHFCLAVLVARDLVTLMQRGRDTCLHCLLAIRKRFSNSNVEFAYLCNQLFFDDFCSWIQSVDDVILTQLTDEVDGIVKDLKKVDIDGLDLDYIESEARMLMISLDDGTYDSDDN